MGNVPFKLLLDYTNGTRSLVRIGDLARAMGYSRQHLTRLCRTGKVPGAKATRGGHWRVFTSGELVKWVAARSPGAVTLTVDPRDHIAGLVAEERRLRAVAKLTRRLLLKNRREQAAIITAELQRTRLGSNGIIPNHASPSARVTSSM
jgi:hypothetical protein